MARHHLLCSLRGAWVLLNTWLGEGDLFVKYLKAAPADRTYVLDCASVDLPMGTTMDLLCEADHGKAAGRGGSRSFAGRSLTA